MTPFALSAADPRDFDDGVCPLPGGAEPSATFMGEAGDDTLYGREFVEESLLGGSGTDNAFGQAEDTCEAETVQC